MVLHIDTIILLVSQWHWVDSVLTSHIKMGVYHKISLLLFIINWLIATTLFKLLYEYKVMCL